MSSGEGRKEIELLGFEGTITFPLAFVNPKSAFINPAIIIVILNGVKDLVTA